MPSIPPELLSQHRDEEVPTYIKSEAFKNASLKNPDMVIILLGTEDAKVDIWKNAAKFQGDYQSLIAEVKDKFTSKPEIYIASPPPLRQSAAQKYQ